MGNFIGHNGDDDASRLVTNGDSIGNYDDDCVNAYWSTM